MVFAACQWCFLAAGGCTLKLRPRSNNWQGVSNYRALLRRTKAAIGVAVVTRAVAMARACLPHLDDEALQLLLGEAEAAAGAGDYTGPTELADDTRRPEANDTDETRECVLRLDPPQSRGAGTALDVARSSGLAADSAGGYNREGVASGAMRQPRTFVVLG